MSIAGVYEYVQAISINNYHKNYVLSVPSGDGIYQIGRCPALAETVLDVVPFKNTQGWKLKSRARQVLFDEFYRPDLPRIKQPIFDQAEEALLPYLCVRVSSAAELDDAKKQRNKQSVELR